MFSFSTRSVFGLLAGGLLGLSISGLSIGCVEQPGPDVVDTDVELQLDQSADELIADEAGAANGVVQPDRKQPSEADRGGTAGDEPGASKSVDELTIKKDPEPAPWFPGSHDT